MDDEIRLIIRTEMAEAVKNLETFHKTSSTVAKEVGSAFDKAKNSLKNYLGAYIGFEAAKKLIKESIDAFLESEKAANDLTVAFAKTSDKADELTKQFKDFAAEQQKLTAYEASAIVSNAAYMQSLTNLSEKGLEQAMTATMDFASRTKKDLPEATQIVSKAIAYDTSILQRYGIQIADGATKSERFANVMTTLNAKFGGGAAAELETYSGKIKQLNNRIGDIKEQIGEGIVRALFPSNQKGVIDSFLSDLEKTSGGLQSIVNSATNIAMAIVRIFTAIPQSLGLIAGRAIWGVQHLATTVGDIVDAVKERGLKGIKEIPGILQEYRKQNLAVTEEWKKDLGTIWGGVGTAISNIFNSTNENIKKSNKKTNSDIIVEEDKFKKDREKILNEWLALSKNGMEKELSELSTKYNEDVQKFSGSIQQKKQLEELYQKARQQIIDKYAKENLEKVLQIVSALGGMVGGEVGQLTNDMIGLIKALTSGDAWQMFAASAVTAINLIKAEVEKGNLFRQMNQQQAVDNLKNIEMQLLQNQLDNLTVLQNAQTKQLQDRQTAEMDYFLNSSTAGQAYNAMKAQEESDRVAAMDATELAKYNVQKRYDEERAALEKKQAEEQKALEDQQKAERNRIKQQQFELEKRIAKDEAWIKVNTAFADVHSKFPMPWDEGTRRSLFDLLQNTYDRTVSAINSRVFIPEFARGTSSAPAGTAIVGERGPELVKFRGGEQVIPNNRLGSAIQNMGSSFNISGGIVLQGVQDVRGLAKELEAYANGMGKTVFA